MADLKQLGDSISDLTYLVYLINGNLETSGLDDENAEALNTVIDCFLYLNQTFLTDQDEFGRELEHLNESISNILVQIVESFENGQSERIRALYKESFIPTFETWKGRLQETLAGSGYLPKVSVVILTYNQKTYLKEAINSVLKQDYGNLSLLVADDCSNDGTEVMMEEFAGNSRVRYIRNEKNLGLTENCRHTFYSYVDGEYVLFVDHDDYLTDEKFVSKAVAMLEANPSLSFVWANCDLMLVESGEIIKNEKSVSEITPGTDYFLNYETSKYPHITSALTTLFRRKNALLMNCFHEQTCSVDLFLHLRLMLSGDVGFIPDTVGIYRTHGKNISNNMPIQYDPPTISALETLKTLAAKQGIAESLLDHWINFRVFSYVRWRFLNSWQGNQKKYGLKLLMDAAQRYPQACDWILDSI